MDLMNIVPLNWCWRKIKTQYQGAIAASVIFVIFAVVYFAFLKTSIDNYFYWGHKIGEYKIKKGERKSIVQWDLDITFNDQIHHKISEMDSAFDYPSININGAAPSYQLAHGDTKNNFPLDEPLIIDGENYTYSIEMVDLEDSGPDTVAYFEVRRKSR